ncbi:MAG: hypothetical protein JWN86_914 [Planctomycetota bacterium]|nr:hypothetical protein [Planctomycetota bacterium]
MDRIGKTRLHTIAIPIFLVSAIAGSTARADAITPWSGASATAQVFVPAADATTQTGPTASAASSKTQDARYYNFGRSSSDDPNKPIYTVPVKGSADAQATGRADGLLHLDASYSTGNPGSSPAILSPLPVAASASWSGDRALVVAPPGVVQPHELRLNFSVTFYGIAKTPGPTNGLTITANGNSASIDLPGPSTSTYVYPYGFNPGSLGFDSKSSHGLYSVFRGPVANEATFHVDLPVSAKGFSDPFSVGISSAGLWGLTNNDNLFFDLNDVTLSLTSITTKDGTLLSDLGDTVTFASGMLAPGAQAMPVPEPSSAVVIVAGIAAVGWFRSGRRRRTMSSEESRPMDLPIAT